MIGFDNGAETNKVLDGLPVIKINTNLTDKTDLTTVKRLIENSQIAFIGTQRSGPFDISESVAQKMLAAHNKSGVSNADVIKQQYNAKDITNRPGHVWVIDFDRFSEEQASQYELPYAYVKTNVFPIRSLARRKAHQQRWWQLAESREGMKRAMQGMHRYIATPIHAKHRLFVWLSLNILPDHALTAIARDDDYFLGVLHSKIHELWSLRLGTSLEDRPRYTPTTSFQTFPFPWPPGQEPSENENELVAEIAYWARELVRWRENWLNPPRPNGLDVVYQKQLQNRTLTNLYNGLVYYRQTVKAGKPFVASEFGNETRHVLTRIEAQELDDIHVGLDTAVFRAYNWSPTLPDELLLERLLQLNAQRTADSEQ